MHMNRQESHSGAENELLQEVLSLIRGDEKSWLYASEYCKRFARGRTVEEKAELNLLRVVYRERSEVHAAMVKRIARRTGGQMRLPAILDSAHRSPLSFITPHENV
jgi:hypothetical protein